jgi:DNA ligase-associated metallophosphoesterase
MMYHENKGAFVHYLEGETLHLLPEKAVFWEEKEMLIVADVHLGKAAHFRKAGIPVPAAVHWQDLKVLSSLLSGFQPAKVLLLGDLFHSALNNEWWDFEYLLAQYPAVQFILVKGNHDMLPEAAYRLPNLEVHAEVLTIVPFVFSHIPPEKDKSQEGYYISGHIHPGVRVIGEKLPCFYFSPEGALLPAFGRFTGFVSIKVRKRDRIFVILPPAKDQAKVIALP